MPNVLIADDDARLAGRLCTALKKDGHNCEKAITVKAAIKQIATGRFQLLICDIHMPSAKEEGLKIIKRAKELEALGRIDKIGVIIITAFADKDNAVETLKLGAFDYFEKSFSSKVFRMSVKRYFEKESQKDRLVQALESWIKRHPDPDKQLFFSDEGSVSARDVLNEITNDTKRGRMFRDALMKIAFSLVEKSKE